MCFFVLVEEICISINTYHAQVMTNPESILSLGCSLMDFSFLNSKSGSFWEKGEAGDKGPSWTLQEELLLESQALKERGILGSMTQWGS